MANPSGSSPGAARTCAVVCSFTAGTDELKGRKLTYDAVRDRVLAAGRFSVFEATSSQRHAALFTRLCQDPDLTVTPEAFPWTGVKRKAAPEAAPPNPAPEAK